MAGPEDIELLTEYATSGSERAFTALAERYVGLVYSAALRQVQNTELAKEVAQTVFIILARKAHALRKGTILSGWLLRTTRFTARNALVSQYRRVRREHEAAQMQNTPSPDSAWEQIAPLLDEAMAELGERDRNAVALRFLEQKSLGDVGLALGVNAETARKRVTRALEKLRRVFVKRGVTLSGVTIMAALSAHAVQAAPTGLSSSIAAVATNGATVSLPALTISTLKLMAWAKFKSGIVGAAFALFTAAIVTVTGFAVAPFFSRAAEVNRQMKLPTGSVRPAIALGSKHGLILASDGSLWSWGENEDGWSVLGLGSITNQTSLRRIGDENDWRSIAVSGHHTLAIKSDGTMWGWGENGAGQLGFAGRARRPQESAPVPAAAGNDWKQAAAGGSHSLGIRSNGTLWAWGSGWAGQLGGGRTERQVTEPKQIGIETNWAKVWAGLLESVAIQSDGSLWYWGGNPDPAIPQTGADAQNILTPIRIGTETNWLDVGFGPWTVLAIRADGTLWCWGREAHKFTGLADQAMNAIPHRVGSDSNWRAICSSGWLFHILQKNDGSLWEISAEATAPIKPPRVVRLEVNKDAVAFAGRGRTSRPHGVVLTRTGEVWTWGKVLGEWTRGQGVEPEPVLREKPWLLSREP